jgi:hypothetical protein
MALQLRSFPAELARLRRPLVIMRVHAVMPPPFAVMRQRASSRWRRIRAGAWNVGQPIGYVWSAWPHNPHNPHVGLR